MKKDVKVVNENNDIQDATMLCGNWIDVNKSVSLGLALLYSIRDKDDLYVMDAEFVRRLLNEMIKPSDNIQPLK